MDAAPLDKPLDQHRVEIEQNKSFWQGKPLIQEIYRGFYQQIIAQIDTALPGRVVELGSGIGNLKAHFPEALCTDLFPNPWLDLSCDAYHLPFGDSSASNLILFDVFHHLQRPIAFLKEAQRVLVPGGRVILFEPFISAASFGAYGLLHHEPVGWRSIIDPAPEPPEASRYYAAQGNATRMFFKEPFQPKGFVRIEATAVSSFAYLFSGGLSKPAIYPRAALPLLRALDSTLSHFPKLFGARCLVVLRKER